jgi:hypothetical protein
VEEASLPLVEGAAAEAVVRRAVVAGVVRHWSGLSRARGSSAWASGRGALVEWLAAAFTARGIRCVRGRRCAEDETMTTTMTAHSRRQVGATRPAGTRANILGGFAPVCFVRSPRACPERPGMVWARRMDEGPDPGEIEDPGARLDRFSPSR